MRTITVKGIGNVQAPVDSVVITMSLTAKDKVYDKAMAAASRQLAALQKSMTSAGFGKDALKTSNFNVETDYENIKDANDNYKRVFSGYEVSQCLTLTFDFTSEALSKVLTAIGSCVAKPELSIRFTVKDATAVSDELLRQAAVNAKRKAAVLSEASGAKLGNLISIDYNWGQLDIFSHTDYVMENRCVGMPGMAPMEIEPEDIDVSDTVTFVWELA